MLREGVEPVPGYQLQKFLGRGGFGDVWSAVAPGGMRAALKFIRLEGKQGLKEYNSIQRLKNIHHPHLLPINALWLLDHDGSPIDTAPFEGEQDTWRVGDMAEETRRPALLVLAMPLGEKNLFELLQEHCQTGQPGIPPAELLEYLTDVAKGLDFLNRSTPADSEFGVQHCDVKPHNILLMGNAAMICDFGLARVLTDQRITTGVAVSPAYAAPEFLRDNRPSTTTDQYSLAITFYELRTGQLPFDATAPDSVRESHLRGELNLSRLSDAEQRVIRRATALNPQDRFPAVGEMMQELAAALRADSPADPRVTMVDVSLPQPDADLGYGESTEPKTVVMQSTGSDTVRLAPGDPRITTAEPAAAPLGPDSRGAATSPSWLQKHREKLSIAGVALLMLLVLIPFLRDDESTDADDEDTKVAQVDKADRESVEPVKLDATDDGETELDDEELLLIPEFANATSAQAENPQPETKLDEAEDDLQLLPPDAKPGTPAETEVTTPSTPAVEEPQPPPLTIDPEPNEIDPAAVALINEQAAGHMQEGDEFNRDKKTRHAVAEFTKAIRLKPTDPKLLYQLLIRRAIACRKEGKKEDGEPFQRQALSDFQQAVQYASDDKRKSGLLFSRATLLLEMQRFDTALEDLSRAIELTPSNAYLYDARAEAYRRRNGGGDAQRAAQDDAESENLSSGGSPNAT